MDFLGGFGFPGRNIESFQCRLSIEEVFVGGPSIFMQFSRLDFVSPFLQFVIKINQVYFQRFPFLQQPAVVFGTFFKMLDFCL